MRNMAALLRFGGTMAHDIKPFKTVEEQIEILIKRGLIVDDIEEAKQLLLNFNYYRISAYSLTLRKNNTFYHNIHFHDIMQIYNFDMELRASILYLLEYIEVSIRTHIGYYHAAAYGPLGYLDCSTFKEVNRYEKFKTDYETAIEEYGCKEVFVMHHKEVYDGQFPIWALVELLSFGSLSRVFKNLTPEIQDEICGNNYGKIGGNYIENWLQGFTILRNICAHRGRIYNREIQFSLKLQKKDRQLLIDSGLHINKASKQLFTYLFVARKIVPDVKVWHTFIDRFITLVEKYPFVRLSYYGFPKNWKDILDIDE